MMGLVVSSLASDVRYRDLPLEHPVVVEQDKLYAQLASLQLHLLGRRAREESLYFACYPHAFAELLGDAAARASHLQTMQATWLVHLEAKKRQLR